MKRSLCLSFFFCLFSLMLQGEKQEKNYKTSVIIPCGTSHAKFLFVLLNLLEQQTVLPDEVVIAMPRARVPKQIFVQMESKTWQFPLTILLTKYQKPAGENRNLACQHASGDIFICQDADDFLHPQRIEIITYFFKKYDVDHLMHSWVRADRNSKIVFKKYEVDEIPVNFSDNFDAVDSEIYTNGNVALAKHVFNTIKWSSQRRGQDTIFNRKVYEQYKNCVAINLPLLVWRTFLSTIDTAGKHVVPEEGIKHISHEGSFTVKEKKEGNFRVNFITIS